MSGTRLTLFKDASGEVRVMTNRDRLIRQMIALALFRNTTEQFTEMSQNEIDELAHAASSYIWAFAYDMVFENRQRLDQYRSIFEQVMRKPVTTATGDEIWKAGYNPETNRGIRWGWDQDLVTHQLTDTKVNNDVFKSISRTFREQAIADGSLKVHKKAKKNPSRFYSNATEQEVSRKDLTDAGMTEFYRKIRKI